MFIRFLLSVVLALGLPAHAHITLDYQVAPAASSYRAAFRVGHGCGASATRQLVVHIPPAVKSARPMPKPGWNVEIQKEKDAVTRVTWTARTRDDALPSSHYDEFVLVARLPAEAGAMYWPVQQICEDGRHDWTEVPRAGQSRAELKSPAAYLEVLPSGGTGGHTH